LRGPVARPAWRYRRSRRPGKSRVTSVRDKQIAVVRQLTDITDIIQLPPTTPALADRTWVLLTGPPEGDGAWRAGNTNAELVSAARAQIAELGKNSPGTSPSSHPPGPA